MEINKTESLFHYWRFISLLEVLVTKFPLVYQEYSKWLKTQIVFCENALILKQFLYEKNYYVSPQANLNTLFNTLNLFETNLK